MLLGPMLNFLLGGKPVVQFASRPKAATFGAKVRGDGDHPVPFPSGVLTFSTFSELTRIAR